MDALKLTIPVSTRVLASSTPGSTAWHKYILLSPWFCVAEWLRKPVVTVDVLLGYELVKTAALLYLIEENWNISTLTGIIL